MTGCSLLIGLIIVVSARFYQVFGEGTDDSGPYRAPTDIMSYTDLITQIQNETKTYHNIYLQNYNDTLVQYLSYHGVSYASLGTKVIPHDVKDVILANIRLIVVFVVDEGTNEEQTYTQTGFKLNNDHVITAQNGVEFSNISHILSCDRHMILLLKAEPSLFNKHLVDDCQELIQINTNGAADIDDIAFFKETNTETVYHDNNNSIRQISLFDGVFDFNDHNIVCFGVNHISVKVSLDDYMSYLGRPLDIVYSFGQILRFDDLLTIACNNNGFETNQCKDEYFQNNPQIVEQLKYNAYSNVTTEWGDIVSGGYCANVFEPYKIVMITSLSKYIRAAADESLYSFANQHTLVHLSPSTANYKSTVDANQKDVLYVDE